MALNEKEQRFLRHYADVKNPSAAQQQTYNSLQQKVGTQKAYTPQPTQQPKAPTTSAPKTTVPTSNSKPPAFTNAKDERYYRHTNPYADYTKGVDMDYINRIGTALKNNTGVSQAQLADYNERVKKWNINTQPKKEFEFDYTPISYDQAASQAGQQVDPLYQRALENVKAQKYQNELNSGEIAAKRGLGHSGLAADQLTKIAIASQGQMSDIEAERAAKIAQMAQEMVQRDQDRADRLRAQQYQEFADQRGYDYQVGRDSVLDNRYNTEFDYQKGRDARRDAEWESSQKWDRAAWEKQFDYQKQRDARRDAEWESTQKDDRAWRQHTFNNLSAEAKAQLQQRIAEFGEEMGWRMFELEYNGNLNQSMNQAQIDAYNAMDFLP